MKSQDIFLLLKLVSLSRQENAAPAAGEGAAAQDWKGWDDGDLFDFEMLPDNSKAVLADPYSARGLASFTGISKSEVSNVLARCYQCGLAKPSRHNANPSVNTKALKEFIIYGIRYVFPVKMQALTRGIATGLTAPVFKGALMSAGDQMPVWPDPRGNTSGFAVEPLFKTVPSAVRKDAYLYILLALVDSIRLGHPRERNLAVAKLEQLLGD